MNDLWAATYELRSAGTLNSKSERRIFPGALVRSGSGFANLHPWPELGDLPLKDSLQDLVNRRTTNLAKRTWDCLQADGEARENGESLFNGLKVPKSHAFLPKLEEEFAARAKEGGFQIAKVKLGRDVSTELDDLRDLIGKVPGIRWRPDFNCSATLSELANGFGDWNQDELAAIDFLEDPVPNLETDWSRLRSQTGLSLANDRANAGGFAQFRICKPAVEEVGELDGRVVVTSYLDHPLGQRFAAWEAGRAGVTEVCGLQSHGVYERSEFSEAMGLVGPDFQTPTDPGLGFGDLLEKLDWKKISV